MCVAFLHLRYYLLISECDDVEEEGDEHEETREFPASDSRSK